VAVGGGPLPERTGRAFRVTLGRLCRRKDAQGDVGAGDRIEEGFRLHPNVDLLDVCHQCPHTTENDVSRPRFLPSFHPEVASGKCPARQRCLPRFPRLKEWAYAGTFFNYTGALASHLAVGDGADVGLIVLAVVLVSSWALRPSARRLGPS